MDISVACILHFIFQQMLSPGHVLTHSSIYFHYIMYSRLATFTSFTRLLDLEYVARGGDNSVDT